MKEKCLTIEAMEKCQCEICKLSREARDLSLKWYFQAEVNKILRESLK
jgi:hypothetical protein